MKFWTLTLGMGLALALAVVAVAEPVESAADAASASAGETAADSPWSIETGLGAEEGDAGDATAQAAEAAEPTLAGMEIAGDTDAEGGGVTGTGDAEPSIVEPESFDWQTARETGATDAPLGAASMDAAVAPASAPGGLPEPSSVAGAPSSPAIDPESDVSPGGVPAPAAPAAAAAWDEAPARPASDALAAEPPAIPSGANAVDAEGRRGRIHVVDTGDTLWDIAASYLRTPWVWPSIWQENDDIENPHRIYPGDHIWISDTAMRKVTRDEAVEMIAAGAELEVPADEAELPLLGGLAAMEEPAPLPVAPPRRVLQRMDIPGVADMSFVHEERLDAATSIVSSSSPRTWLLQGDQVVLGLGEGETRVGERYDVFRDAVPVRDPETGQILGYHVEILGWLEVRKVHGDSATAEIRMSSSEMMRGDQVIEREDVPAQFALVPAPADLDGRIIYTPSDRTQMQLLDYVYLNRGAVHGMEIGAEVEVYESGELVPDRVRGTTVRTPDQPVGRLVIVTVQPTTSVGFVAMSSRELNIGDMVRPRIESVAMR